MSRSVISAKELAVVVLTGLFLLLLPRAGNACRLYGIIGSALPADLLQTQLITAPNSLEALSHSQLDGWGVAYYPQYGDEPVIERGATRAFNDPDYDAAVAEIDASLPQITVVHIRTCSSGCCSHGTDTIPDPHPFYREKNGKIWTFVHNGGVDKTRMTGLLGDYLVANPPNGSDLPACDPSDPKMVVDSELYFLFVLKMIEENGWNAVRGISAAITAMVTAGETGAINFILSDGETIWAFRRGSSAYTLYYRNGSMGTPDRYAAVASQYPTATQGSWVMITDYQLVVLTRNAAPAVIHDVRVYCPGDFNEDRQVETADLEEFAESYGREGAGDLDFDGDVDGSDLSTLVRVYGNACS